MAKYLTPNEVANKIEDMLERLEALEGVHQALGERLDSVLTNCEQILNIVTTPPTPEATPDDETI